MIHVMFSMNIIIIITYTNPHPWQEAEAIYSLETGVPYCSSQHHWCISSILSTDLQIPLQLQSNEAAQGLAAWPIHSQSALHSSHLDVILESQLLSWFVIGWFYLLPKGVPQQRLLGQRAIYSSETGVPYFSFAFSAGAFYPQICRFRCSSSQ